MFLIQEEDGEEVTYELNSMRTAISTMQDADDSKSGFQFKGRIIAALNSQGVATWAVVISDTEIKTASAGSPSTRTMQVYVQAYNLNDGKLINGGSDFVTVSGTDGERVKVRKDDIAGYKQVTDAYVTFQRGSTAVVQIFYAPTSP